MANDATKIWGGTITSIKLSSTGFGGLAAAAAVGYTGTSASLSSSIESTKQMSGQSLIPIKNSFKEKTHQFKFSMLQYELRNLAIALGIPVANAVGETYLSGSTAAPDSFAMECITNNPNQAAGFDVGTLTIFDMQLAQGGTVQYTVGGENLVEVTFDVFANAGLPFVMTQA